MKPILTICYCLLSLLFSEISQANKVDLSTTDLSTTDSSSTIFSISNPPITKAESTTPLSVVPLDLTDAEIDWLESNPQVTFTGDPNWLPYEAFTDLGEYIGIVAEHLKLISEITGLKIKISPSATWTESIQKAKDSRVDIISETDDSDLKSHLNFTQPYLFNPIVIVMGINESYVEVVPKIADKRIALIKDYGYAAKIRRKYPDIQFVTVDHIQDGLISVSTGKVDALFCTLALCSYTIHELGLNDVKIVGKTEFDTKLALGVQSHLPELLSILNKAIQSISQGQKQLILDEWIKHEYVEKTDFTLSLIISIIAILLLSVFSYWNRRLAHEINLRKETEKQLIQSNRNNERFRVIFYESAVGHAVNCLKNGDFIEVNQCFANITGHTIEEFKNLTYRELTPESYSTVEEIQLKLLKETGRYGPYEKHYIHKNGEHIAVRLNGAIVKGYDDEDLILSVVEDISAFEDTKEKLRLSSLVMENSSECMIITDENNRIIAANPAFSKITGYSLLESLGKDPGSFKSGRHDAKFYDDMWDCLETSGRWQGEIWDKRKNGEVFVKWMNIDTIKNTEGKITRYIALFSDITTRKKSEETIWRQANFDTLTGLPNRDRFQYRLEEEMAASKKAEQCLALLLIDLDEFKEVNDTLGHDVGDKLLKVVAERIVSCVGQSDIVARLGGDEFTIIVSGFENIDYVNTLAEKLIESLVTPYQLDAEVVHISASIGITLYPDDAVAIDVLIKNADQAMYEAKSRGRNRYSYFTQSLHDEAQNRRHLSNDLRTALSQDQFEVFFQPIVDLSTNGICKAEALLRWKNPERGMVSPTEFISLAEDIGVINEVGSWVLQEAKRWGKYWNAQFDIELDVSVNISPVQFKTDQDSHCSGWIETFNSLSNGHVAGASHKQNVIVEITEGLLLDADPEILDKLYKLRSAGIEVAIDDFGTGYSSLSYLKKLPIDYLKIDRSFISNLEHDKHDLALSKAIIVMAHEVGLRVIAEGVESEEQQKILTHAGCDFAQGYLYSKPVPPEEFELLLKDQVGFKRKDFEEA
ncbi:MAG: EAL domain-containing protein [Pseudomonadales bacterium]|nr:EAL domain-containing protein [Pseudomonadales bacterium]